jgi:AbrB family looped-hinge helix DNA binding protein
MRITSKGQVTIPKSVRERLGFLQGTEVEIFVDDNSARIVKKSKGAKKPTRGEMIVSRLGSGKKPNLSTDEIMRLTRAE